MSFFRSKKHDDKLRKYAQKVINFRDHLTWFLLASVLFSVTWLLVNKRFDNFDSFFRPIYPILLRGIIIILHYVSLRRTNPVKSWRIEKEYQKLLQQQQSKTLLEQELSTLPDKQ